MTRSLEWREHWKICADGKIWKGKCFWGLQESYDFSDQIQGKEVVTMQRHGRIGELEQLSICRQPLDLEEFFTKGASESRNSYIPIGKFTECPILNIYIYIFNFCFYK